MHLDNPHVSAHISTHFLHLCQVYHRSLRFSEITCGLGYTVSLTPATLQLASGRLRRAKITTLARQHSTGKLRMLWNCRIHLLPQQIEVVLRNTGKV
jgi:hypothetical protein